MLQLVILVFLTHVGRLHASKNTDQTSREDGKMVLRNMAGKNAFNDDFNACMINRWIVDGVLRNSPANSCKLEVHSKLCYGVASRRPYNAQFISCYNKDKLIPKFTAYVVNYSAPLPAYKRPKYFRQDTGPFAPNPQAAHGDISKPKNATGNYFCSRGHLTPNGAFDTKDERDLTFIMTNVAPQWQPFNGGNWAAVESAVKLYVQTVKRGVYVFTGTAGETKCWQKRWRRTYQTSGRRPVAPKYFWKAVCDPIKQESIFFIAENNVGVTSKTKVTSASCYGKITTEEKGVVECESISQAASIGRCIWNWWHGLMVPDFHPVKCGIDKMGDFLQPYLTFE